MDFKAILQDTHRASGRASDEARGRARKAVTALGDGTRPDRAFVFNAFLNLLDRGAPPTEANILAESTKLCTASEAHYEAQRKRRESA